VSNALIGKTEGGGWFILHSKTNKCTYLKCVYHMLFITYMFQPLSQLLWG